MMYRLILFLLILLGFGSLNAQVKYPYHIYGDSIHAPFYYGVASGDPQRKSVVIWTKIEPENINMPQNILWQVARDSGFTSMVAQAYQIADSSHDFTLKVDVNYLLPDSSYFYRFRTTDGRTSAVGRTKTLPGDSVSQLRFAVMSCSSVWSGYFNAYARIAERRDIDYVIHLGDYAYDYVDNDEQVRVPEPFPKDVSNLAEWRERHRYYLLDPDLRAARQAHPWIVIWDNHDLSVEKPGKPEDAVKAFYEYIPLHAPNPQYPEKLYRSFRFGSLANLIMTDMFSFRGKEKFDSTRNSIYGIEQTTWLYKQLLDSQSTWRLIGNQEMMGSWISKGIPKFFKAPGDGTYFDPSSWDGYIHDRDRLYDFLAKNQVKNFVALSGDMHMSYCINLTKNPRDKSWYNKRRRTNTVGVEFLPSSITRGNFDEAGIPKAFIPFAQAVSKSLNPHHVYNQFSKHGYGILDVTKDRCVAEFWYSPILSVQSAEHFGRGYTVLNGISHWQKRPNKKLKKSSKYGFGIR